MQGQQLGYTAAPSSRSCAGPDQRASLSCPAACTLRRGTAIWRWFLHCWRTEPGFQRQRAGAPAGATPHWTRRCTKRCVCPQQQFGVAGSFTSGSRARVALMHSALTSCISMLAVPQRLLASSAVPAAPGSRQRPRSYGRGAAGLRRQPRRPRALLCGCGAGSGAAAGCQPERCLPALQHGKRSMYLALLVLQETPTNARHHPLALALTLVLTHTPLPPRPAAAAPRGRAGAY